MRALAYCLLVACAGSPTAEPVAPPPQSPPPPQTQLPPAPPPVAIPTQCASDADCVATNFPSCCSCPQCSVGEPRALLRAQLEHDQAECATAQCNNESMCGIAGMCPPG